jgi:hypothetical protein
MQELHGRFREHTCRLFRKHGITVVGFWTPLEADAAEARLVYLLVYASKEAADGSWNALRDDPEWKAVRAETERNGNLLARPPESQFLKPTDYSPLQ